MSGSCGMLAFNTEPISSVCARGARMMVPAKR